MQISVIIPSYKPQNYVYKCIDSIGYQSINSDRYEVIIVLNGEEEPYFSSLKRYIERFSNFRCIYTQKKGVSAARNLGLDMTVHSDFIVFLDDDDYVTREYLEELYNTITREEVDIVQSNLKSDINGIIQDDYISNAFKLLKNKRFNIVLFRNFFSSVCGKIYDRKIIGNVRFREEIKLAEDAIFLFELSRNLRSFCLTGKDCIYYRNVREGSTLRSHRSVYDIFRNFREKSFMFSSLYFLNPFKYNFLFYLSRIMAITKVLFIELKTKILK